MLTERQKEWVLDTLNKLFIEEDCVAIYVSPDELLGIYQSDYDGYDLEFIVEEHEVESFLDSGCDLSDRVAGLFLDYIEKQIA